jgi:hypothetical protein
MKTINHWREESKKMSEDGKISHAHGWQNQHCENRCTTKSKPHLQCNPYQNSNDILHRDRKINPKIHIETQKPQMSKVILSKMSNAGDITIPDFKLYYRSITIKTGWY